jgi:putative PEP-CTERM system TPR-repeat lipoprotein
LANFYWATRKAADTERTLQQAHMLDPGNPTVNQMLAMFKIATGKRGDAEPYFKKLAEVSTGVHAKILLADYYMTSGRPNDALPLLQELSSRKESRSAAELRLAELKFREGHLKEAHAQVDAVLTREASNAFALVQKARFLLHEGKRDEAIQRLEAAVKASPTSAEAQFALGRAYLTRNDFKKASAAFTETVRLNPRAVAAQLELSRLELATGHPDSSVSFAEQALKNAPRDPAVRLALVRGLIARRDLRRAESELQALMVQYPDNTEVLTQAGMIAQLKGDSALASRLLTNALGINEGNLEALAALVALDLSQKNHARALSRVEARLVKTPADSGTLLLAASTYAATGDLSKSEQTLRKTIDADPSNLQAYAMLGRLFVSQKRLDEALKEFDALSKRQPRSVQAHTLAGMILEAQNKVAEAKKRYEQALSIDPETPVAANNLAWMYAVTGENLDVALQLAQTATRRLPDNPATQDTLGWIYYKKDLPGLAVPPFQKSVERDPANPLYHFHLGLALAKVGDAAKARLALEQALALAPGFNGAAEAKQVLASLKG